MKRLAILAFLALAILTAGVALGRTIALIPILYQEVPGMGVTCFYTMDDQSNVKPFNCLPDFQLRR